MQLPRQFPAKMAETVISKTSRSKAMFSLSDELMCLRVCNNEDPSKNICSFDRDVGDLEETLSVVSDSIGAKGVKESLVVLFSVRKPPSPDDDGRQRLWPFGVRKETFDAISKSFSLSRFYSQMHSDTTSMFFDENDSAGTDSDGIQRCIMQIEYPSTMRWSLALSFDPSTCTTGALVHGLFPQQIDDLVKDIIPRSDQIGLPMLLPFVVFTSRARSTNSRVIQCHREMVDWERRTGLSPEWRADNPIDRTRHEKANLGLALAELTTILSKLAYLSFLGDFEAPMLAKFDRFNQRSVQAMKGTTMNQDSHHARLCAMETEFRKDNAFCRETFQAAKERARYLTGRTNAQVQAIYSLIAQRDSALALKDNAALKGISEDQRTIALAATRDSAAMKTISIITAVFLPATFTATFFSSAFFRFPTDEAADVVSKWIWVYVVVTTLLSVGVLGWWYMSRRRKERDIELGLLKRE
ncbi:hypothetical protein QBC47DRAFT_380218 [Echria macrotheca]|uniref:Uncharacterized protein n=1 Tax=Echria macrotheca TaxID=438768 RepID=A0AAJ0FCX4_9PEZI|nr:hypothetical protein QBC47DRAFT_380218 [Echria macrotheca]